MIIELLSCGRAGEGFAEAQEEGYEVGVASGVAEEDIRGAFGEVVPVFGGGEEEAGGWRGGGAEARGGVHGWVVGDRRLGIAVVGDVGRWDASAESCETRGVGERHQINMPEAEV